jgi:RNA polymerase sigma factor (sigma-70 family)
MSPAEESVTLWLSELKAGDSAAAGRIWKRYVARLVRVAKNKLGRSPRRVADEEDVVLSAFNGFLEGVDAGRFVKLDDRDDLWQVLVMLTERHAVTLRRHERARKRGGGEVRGESVFEGSANESAAPYGLAQNACHEVTPAFAVEFAQQLRGLLEGLTDDTQRKIATGKLAGWTNQELASQLGVSLRTVERKLGIIRDKWSSALDE